MITLENMTVKYPGFDTDISLHIPDGSCTALVGLNGSGKSTVFNSILGLLKPQSGTARVFDTDTWNLSVKQKQKIAAVFSDSSYNSTLTVPDILKILASFYPDFDPVLYKKLTDQLHLPAGKPVGAFSTGMAARFKVIAAVCCSPRLLILDEPTAGLDVLARDEILDLLREWMEEPDHSILISSHNAKDIQSLCDDFYLIQNGRNVMHEDFSTLLDHYGVIHTDVQSASQLDLQAIVCRKTRAGECRMLCTDRQFYQENYPGLKIEPADLDDVIELMNTGDRI